MRMLSKAYTPSEDSSLGSVVTDVGAEVSSDFSGFCFVIFFPGEVFPKGCFEDAFSWGLPQVMKIRLYVVK